MIKLHQLTNITVRKKKRLGQGHGSGKGKTGGRGTKGQKARNRISLGRGEMNIIKRLPLLRGKYRNKPFRKKPIVVNVKFLNILPANSIVDLETLAASHIVRIDEAKANGVKILGDGELNIPLTVKLPCSGGARAKIEAAGGKVEHL